MHGTRARPEPSLRREVGLALALLYAGTGLLALASALIPALRPFQQFVLALLLIAVPDRVLRGAPLRVEDLGVGFGPWGRTLGVAAAAMAVVFPLFVLGFHLVQTRAFDARADWSLAGLTRWDEALRDPPDAPCARDRADAAAWVGGGGVWLLAPAGASLVVEAPPDAPALRGRLVACRGGAPTPAGPLAADGRAARAPAGAGLWLALGDADRFALTVRGPDGAPWPAERLRLGRWGEEAPADGRLAGKRDAWWLPAFLLVHLLLVALPEEWFFRGYLQGRLDQLLGTRWRLLGASFGPGLVLSAAAFALLHPILVPGAHRLLTFFPGLWFGWLRARTGTIGAAVLAHAGANLLQAVVAAMYV